MNSERNIFIDVFKVLYTILIAIYHFYGFNGVSPKGGFIGVEFFFMASGLLLANLFEKESVNNRLTSAKDFIFRRLKKYYPHYFFSLIILFVFQCAVVNHDDLLHCIYAIRLLWPELVLLHGTIISDESTVIYNSCTWYLSVLLIIEYVYWCLMKCYRNTSKFNLQLSLIPIISLGIYAYMFYQLGTVNNWRTHAFSMLNYGILRGGAGVGLGIFVYYASIEALDRNQDKYLIKLKVWQHICGIVLLVLPFVFSFMFYGKASFLYLIMFVFGFYFIADTAGYFVIKKQWRRRVVGNIAKVSYGMYLNHYLISMIFVYCLNSRKFFSCKTVIIYLMVLFVYSAITVKVVSMIKNLITSFHHIFLKER